MLASLKAAEARIAAGQCVEHDPDTFVDRLMEVRAGCSSPQGNVTYKVVRDVVADREINDFGRYAADYSEVLAREQFARLNRVFTVDLAEGPNTWAYIYITGAPYRAYLFRVGRRTEILDRLQR